MRKFLALLTLFSAVISGGNIAQAEEGSMRKAKSLVIYFSKAGEQYGVGKITKGNTAILAEMIAAKIGADLFEVKVKNDKYPDTYKPLTEVALKEKNANARPEIVGDVNNFADYDVVFIGTPNWWADMPMALYTFLESRDFSGKTVVPFVTHEGSGMSSIPNKINQTVSPKAMLKGLAMYGHVAQNNQAEAEEKVTEWLQEIGF